MVFVGQIEPELFSEPGQRTVCKTVTRKYGIEETFIVAPETAPAWSQDRAALWNTAEESETRRNAVTTCEWGSLCRLKSPPRTGRKSLDNSPNSLLTAMAARWMWRFVLREPRRLAIR